MTLNVIVEDYRNSNRQSLFFLDDEFKFVIDNQTTKDKLITDLADTTEFFKGCETWGDLKPQHWRFLLGQSVSDLTKLSLTEQQSDTNRIVQTFRFLLLGLAYCIQQNSQSELELLKVHYVEDNMVLIEYFANMNIKQEDWQKLVHKKPNIRIVS